LFNLPLIRHGHDKLSHHSKSSKETYQCPGFV
jgi:hypothetical protein